MALSAMEIYKELPKTNCKDCGAPTCMAFAMFVVSKQRELTGCPHLSSEALFSFSDSCAPPMKLVSIGPDHNRFEIGQETVMYRHEEKFHRRCGVAVRVSLSLSDDEVKSLVHKINTSVFERVGTPLSVSLLAVEVDDCADPGARTRLVTEESKIPVILVGTDTKSIKEALDSMRSEKPLIYKASLDTVDDLGTIAGAAGVPLAVGADTMEELAELTVKAKEKGVSEIMLAFNGNNPGETLRSLTITRRAALKKNFRPFGYPAIVEVCADSQENETILASIYAAKYAGIVMINGFQEWELLPVLTMIQDIYTDPQVPNTVESKLYEIGNPGPDAPLLCTTNFSLTFFSVSGEVERSKIPAYISVVNTEGLGVLNAYAGDKISAEKVVKTLKEQHVMDKISHRTLIIPGLLPILKSEIEENSEWKKVIIGPENSREIPGFLKEIWR